jgi:hypothetical protein
MARKDSAFLQHTLLDLSQANPEGFVWVVA